MVTKQQLAEQAVMDGMSRVEKFLAIKAFILGYDAAQNALDETRESLSTLIRILSGRIGIISEDEYMTLLKAKNVLSRYSNIIGNEGAEATEKVVLP